MNAEVMKIAKALDERPELKELIESFMNLSKQDQELVFDELLDILLGKDSDPNDALKEKLGEGETTDSIINQIPEDDFLDMIYNPLFAFMSWINNINDEPEKHRIEADEYRQAFRQRYSEECQGTPLETMYVAFAFGFDQSTRTTLAYLECSEPRKRPDQESDDKIKTE